MKFAVVGGGGYIGYHIGVDLVRKEHVVILADVNEPDQEWIDDSDIEISENGQLQFKQTNILDICELNSVLKDVDCVIHCASYGMSGKEQMPSHWDMTELINVTGTKNVIEACISNGVKALVYTSTFNVVFGGEKIMNGNECMSYFPLHRHIDHYSRTKSIAEQLLLMADKKCTETGTLRTCALRLAGVMGLKEKRHLPRIVDTLPLLKFRYGYGDSLVQFCSLQNVVQAHVKAAMEILKSPDVLGGQAYFISDEKPINNLEFFRPLIERLGYSFPKIVVPMPVIWAIAYFVQFVHTMLMKFKRNHDFTPVITPAEIYKTAVTHHFSCAKANKHFGYKAENPNDLTQVVEYFYQKQRAQKESIWRQTNFYVCLSVVFLVGALVGGYAILWFHNNKS